MLEITSFVISVLSVAIAIIQTLKIRHIRYSRNQQLSEIWASQKNLSGILAYSDDSTHPRTACLTKSQDIEHSIARLVADLRDWKRSDLDELKKNGIIDDHDYGFLTRIL
jgi:hypothetical protein